MSALSYFDPIGDRRGLHRLDFDLGVNPVVAGREETFWNRKTSLADLIARQGSKPITNIDDLKADFWPEGESIDEFVEMVRRWRSEGE